MRNIPESLDQILYVPAHIERRGRTASEIAAEEPCAEQGFVTSTMESVRPNEDGYLVPGTRQITVWCCFFRPDGDLRTKANSESCKSEDLMPFAPRTTAAIAEVWAACKALP